MLQNVFKVKHTGRNPGFDRVLASEEDVLLEEALLEDTLLEKVLSEDLLIEFNGIGAQITLRLFHPALGQQKSVNLCSSHKKALNSSFL